VLHIARSEDWSRAKALGTYALPGGVVHCCSSSQLALVVAAHFPESAGHVVLLLDRERVHGEIEWRTFVRDGRSESFPTLHGSVPVEAVVRVAELADELQRYAARGRLAPGQPNPRDCRAMPRPDDLTPEHAEILRRMTPEQRYQAGRDLYWTMRRHKKAYLRSIHPDWSEERLDDEVRRIFQNART